MKPSLFVALLAVSLAATSHGQLLPAERKGVEDALFLGNMRVSDLDFERKPFSDPYRFALADLCLSRPLEGADALMSLHRQAEASSLPDLLEMLRATVLMDPPRAYPSATSPPVGASQIPKPVQAPVFALARAVASANAMVKQALIKLSDAEKRQLIESLPQWATEEPSIRFAFVKQRALDQAAILKLLAKVDLPLIRLAAARLARDVRAEIPRLQAAARSAPIPAIIRERIGGITVEIGGVGPDDHTSTDAMLTIDLGGNDRYTGRHGAGVGYAAVLIDLSGDDRYDVVDLSAGAGLLGIGLAYDLGGVDSLTGKSLCFGAGLAGVGVMINDGGSDAVSSTALAQGFGQFGIGLYLDTKGNDRYSVGLLGQGAARTQGVGWLADRQGQDVYRAGGLIVEAPLFKDVHRSQSQGFGSGYREDTGGISGGIGLLTDFGSDDDAYLGETYCQAASYWFSIGSTLDAGGNDSYTAYHYAQASAMHMTSAYLFDLAGDDGYMMKFGACHAIGHDYGVALLLDRSGSDIYAARDSRPAIGNANGLGIFIEGGGEDRYFGPPAVANAARGSGSLAVFVDLNGPDRFADGLTDGQASVHDRWAVALDLENRTETETMAAPKREPVRPGSLPMPSDADLETVYAKATQWGVGIAQEEVATNVERLIAIGKPALEWMLRTKLRTATRLHIRAFEAVVNALGDDGKSLLAPRILSADDDEARVALTIAINTQARQAAPFLSQALHRPKLQRLAARAAGALGVPEVAADLLPLTLNGDKLTALNAVLSLQALKNPVAISTAQALLKSDELPIRKAAIDLIASHPEQALEIGRNLIQDADERSARTGVELLARVGTDAALNLVGPLLSSGKPGLRIQALLALNGRCPAPFQAALLDLRRDVNPLVRSVASRIDPGP